MPSDIEQITNKLLDRSLFSTSYERQFKSPDKSKTITFGAWGGRMQISISSYPSTGSRPISVIVMPQDRQCFTNTFEYLLNHVSPGTNLVIKKKDYNSEDKKFEWVHFFQFGFDDDGIAYVKYKNKKTDETCECKITGYLNFESSDEMTPVDVSLVFLKDLHNFVSGTVSPWELSRALSSNNVYKPKRDNNGSGSGEKRTPRPSEADGGDYMF